MTPNRGDLDRRQEFRRFVRTHHPDRGGDPAVFADGVAAHQRGAWPTVSAEHGSFASRWPGWVAADDPRLAGPTSFYRRRRGIAGALGTVRRGLRRRRKPSRIR